MVFIEDGLCISLIGSLQSCHGGNEDDPEENGRTLISLSGQRDLWISEDKGGQMVSGFLLGGSFLLPLLLMHKKMKIRYFYSINYV